MLNNFAFDYKAALTHKLFERMNDETLTDALRSADNANNKKIARFAAMFNNAALCDAMQASEIEATRLTRAIYASEKVVRFANCAFVSVIKERDFDDNTFAMFKTAMNFLKAQETDETIVLTFADLKCAISKYTIADEKKKALIFRRSAAYDVESTISAQSQTSKDALVTLNILQVASRDTFKINRNAVADALCKKFAIA